MEKKLCCPNCKSRELIFPEGGRGNSCIECQNCEYQFYEENTLTNLINRYENLFTTLTVLFIIFLILGSFLLFGYSCISHGIEFEILTKAIMVFNLTGSLLFTMGMVFYALSILCFYSIFGIRKHVNSLRNQRRYMKSNGYEV